MTWDLRYPADSPAPGSAWEGFLSCIGGYFGNKVFAEG